MIVYVVFKGEYSDKHIVGVAIDKEKADVLKKIYSRSWDEAYIEEYDTDAPIIEYKPIWEVRFNTVTGAVLCAEVSNANPTEEYEDSIEEEINFHHYANAETKIESIYVYADDEEKAIKIAIDRRAEYLAKKEGV